MGILDTASEIELIICLALTNSEMIGMRGGTLVPVTDGARAAVGTFRNEVDHQEYHYELTPVGVERWVNDALEERLRGTTGSLPHMILQSLKEQCRTRMQSLIIPEGNPRGLLLDTKLLLETWDRMRDLIVGDHKLSFKVIPRLSVGVWAGKAGAGEQALPFRVAEPNVTIRLKHPNTLAGEEQPVGRRAIEEIATLIREELLQDSVAVRARVAGGEWRFVLVPGNPEGEAEKSVALFSGTRAAAERMVQTLPGVLRKGRLADLGFTFEVRPVDREGPEALHVLIARHVGSSSLRELLCGLFQAYAQLNLVVDPLHGTERDFFLPVAHNCPEDLLAYDDLTCDEPGRACRRWSVRYRFVPGGTTPLSVRDCHCDGRAHPFVGIDRTRKGSKYVQVRLDCCDGKTCNHSRRGDIRFVPAHPDGANEVTREWLMESWALSWLDDL